MNTKILNDRLNSILKTSSLSMEYEIKKLKNEIENELIIQEAKKITKINIINEINKELKEIAKKNKNRPALAYAKKYTFAGIDYLMYCNNYSLFAIKYKDIYKDIIINPSQALIDAGAKPIELINLIPTNYSNVIDININADNLKEYKNKKALYKKDNQNKDNFIYFKDADVLLNPIELLKAINILGLDNLQLWYDSNFNNKPIIIKNKEGNFVLIAQIRHDRGA